MLTICSAKSGGSVFLLATLLSAGCATTVPKEIREPPPDNPALAEVRTATQRFIGAHVRWGGTIASVDNRETETRVEVVARELGRDGRPRETDRSPGRFIAAIDGFLDPVVYAEGRDLTVTGVIAGEVTHKIGDHDYTFPVVRVNSYLLWPPRPEPLPYDVPPWYYDPWYPWHPYYHPYRWPYHPI